MASIFEQIWGQQPEAARYKKQGLGPAQSQSILGNIGSFGDIAKLGDLYSQYMTDKQNELLPGYSKTLALGQQGAQDLLSTGEGFLKGNVPQDVLDKSMRDSAFGALQGGFAGSGMSRGLTARDLGLTSLDIMNRGAQMIGQGGNSAQQWSSLAKGDILDPSSMFTTPWQQEQANVQNETLFQQSQQNALNAKNAPNPVAAGLFNTAMSQLGQASGAATSLGSAYLQGGGGGGGGGGGL